MTDAPARTIETTARELRAGTLSSSSLTEMLLTRIESSNADLGALTTVSALALEAAEQADAAFAAGTDRGPLQGIPIVVKDIIATQDSVTRAGSDAFDSRQFDGVDSPVVARLRSSGAVILGKSTTSEFAFGLPDITRSFPIPRNPWKRDHSASGSSSGTAIAVAAGQALGGVGTDTGGSVRLPAAATGITGLKVTYGRVPKSGVVPLAYSLDSVGPMARSAYDCALLLEAMAGFDSTDPSSVDRRVPPYASQIGQGISGVRVGVPEAYFLDNTDLSDVVRAGVMGSVDRLRDAGASIIDIELPHASAANDANSLTYLAEAFAYHRKNLIARWDDYGVSMRDLLARATLFSGADYVQAQRVRRQFTHEVSEAFESVDVIVTPVAASLVPAASERDLATLFTAPGFTGQWNLIGLPAISLPCGLSDSGLPLSFQVIGRPFEENKVLQVAHAYQLQTDWHLRTPPEIAHVPTASG